MNNSVPVRRAKSLISRFYGDTGLNGQWFEQGHHLTDWLKGLHDTGAVSHSTFISYRKWLAAFADEQGHSLLAEDIRRVGKKYRSPEGEKGLAKEGVKGSHRSDVALYASGIDEKQIKSIARQLIETKPVVNVPRYQYGLPAMFALRCTMLTGLRPIEWFGAKLYDSLLCEYDGRVYDGVLVINTAKQKHRPGGEGQMGFFQNQRHLILDTFREDEYHSVRQLVHLAPKDLNDFNLWYEQLRKTITRVAGRIRTDTPELLSGPLTWYTGRHIFASEVRRDGGDKYDLAAMLGHADTQNQRYYGDLKGDIKRLFTHSIPRAWPGESAMVKRSAEDLASERGFDFDRNPTVPDS